MKILVYGCAEFGQVVRNLVLNCGHEFEGFIDDYQKGKDVLGTYNQVREYLCKGFDDQDVVQRALESEGANILPVLSSDCGIVIAVGYRDLKTRWSIYQKVKADGYRVPSLVHPQAIVDKAARIGEGTIIMAGAIVDYNAEIKDLAVLWNGVVVSHDSVIGENTFLSPNCTVCGCSVVDRDCFIGAGAVITDHVKVPDGSFVKAGSAYA